MFFVGGKYQKYTVYLENGETDIVKVLLTAEL